jgi:putative ABC transport system permease protein
MAIGTLALGIAATTALFAVVNATLLTPLPYRQPNDIYFLKTAFVDGRFTIGMVSTAEFQALREQAPSIVSAAWAYPTDDVLITETGSRQVRVAGISDEFFELFGVEMARGRALRPGDVDDGGANAVLSHRLWTSRFGGDPAIIGQRIQLAGRRPTVVGIAPPDFDVPHDADVWIAFRIPRSTGHLLLAYIRMPPGQGPETIAAPMRNVFVSLEDEFPDQVKGRVFTVHSLLDTVVGDLGPILLIAFGAAALLMLLALVNIASLLIARSASRARELAVRTALGATRWRLVRQAAGEALLLATAGALLGTGLAWAAIRLIVAIGGEALPRVQGMRIDGTVLLFAVGATAAAAMVFALVPALSMPATQRRLAAVINDGGRTGQSGRSARRWLQVMVLVEVALAIALVTGAGRLLLSLDHLTAIDPGFAAEGRLVIDAQLPGGAYFDPARQATWFEATESALRGLGADRVAATTTLPLHREWDSTVFVDIVGRPTAPEDRPNGRLRRVSPGFFDTLGIELRTGRDITAADRLGAPPVCIVNEHWARTYLPGIEPLGERIIPFVFVERTPEGMVPQACAIVGVVADIRYGDLTSEVEPIVYVPLAQTSYPHRSIVVTTPDGHPERLMSRIRESLARIDPLVAIDTGLMTDAVSPALTWSRLGLILMSAFGSAALVLAAVGIFGVVAYVVTQRTGEMAVRLALGATRRQVFGQILLQAGRVILAGTAIGALVAWWTGRLMAGYLHGLGAGGVLVIGIGAAVVLATSLCAVMLPARAAAAIAPSRLLRG